MKAFKTALLLSVALVFTGVFASAVIAEEATGDSITVTIDRRTQPNTIFHPEWWDENPATVTVYNYVIRDYYGTAVEDVVIKTASGRTEIPIDRVKEIHTKGWLRRYKDEIDYVDTVIDADIVLTDGTQLSGAMNADLGTIEGDTDLGTFFLGDPHTIKDLVFNRAEVVAQAPVEVVEEIPEPVVEEVTIPDSDGDGVLDDKDECPDTPAGASVTSVGCWAIKGINFDYDKWDIKPEYFGVLDENVKVLQMNPSFKIEVQGHTDSIASEKYNQGLSEKRAESVKAYFVSKGIAADRISTRGFGELRPIEPNDTPAGRAQNRRIEIEITSR
ncbi:MAG: OmpA family protein [Candidatus Abyssobacteria bacterium SURF_17]|uniref:OmpA family protein n=1 Tax=Candidatus Abyssobacteria bacterium SURF_17 TaxID=2093361 RepID=A0A419ENB0_9BACT|nr:MAG: OmpA family protein [Candidatus Abyssubacteria bacterium SURF_17]